MESTELILIDLFLIEELLEIMFDDQSANQVKYTVSDYFENGVIENRSIKDLTIVSNIELFKTGNFKKEIKSRFEQAVNTDILRKELWPILQKATEILEFYDNHFYYNNQLDYKNSYEQFVGAISATSDYFNDLERSIGSDHLTLISDCEILRKYSIGVTLKDRVVQEVFYGVNYVSFVLELRQYSYFYKSSTLVDKCKELVDLINKSDLFTSDDKPECNTDDALKLVSDDKESNINIREEYIKEELLPLLEEKENQLEVAMKSWRAIRFAAWAKLLMKYGYFKPEYKKTSFNHNCIAFIKARYKKPIRIHQYGTKQKSGLQNNMQQLEKYFKNTTSSYK